MIDRFRLALLTHLTSDASDASLTVLTREYESLSWFGRLYADFIIRRVTRVVERVLRDAEVA